MGDSATFTDGVTMGPEFLDPNLRNRALPKPYYSNAGITIYHGDCREVLPSLPKFDLLLTDPPYGIRVDTARHQDSGRVQGHGHRRAAKRAYPKTTWDDARPTPEDFASMLEMSSHAVIFGGNHFALPPSRCWLVWDKVTIGNAFADCELAWTNFDKPVRKITWLWNGFARENSEERYDHPTQKPLGVMKWCISLCPEAKTVLDPFCGSGTTLVAAKSMGLSATGIEAEEKYCEIAANRLSQEVFDFQAVSQ